MAVLFKLQYSDVDLTYLHRKKRILLFVDIAVYLQMLIAIVLVLAIVEHEE